MKFNLSFASALLDSDFGPECLFESVNGGLHIRINGAAPACRIILDGTVRIPRNQGLCLTNRVISLNDLLGGVEYRIEVRERQERFRVSGSKSVLSQPLLNFRRQAEETQHIGDRCPVFSHT